MIGSYRTVSVDARIIGGKLAYAKKGIAFCKLQLVSAASKFQTEHYLVVTMRIR